VTFISAHLTLAVNTRCDYQNIDHFSLILLLLCLFCWHHGFL